MNEERPPKGPIDSIHAEGTESHYTTDRRRLHLRRAASWRLPVQESGRRADPWFYDPPTAGYEAAVHHLLGHGLTPTPNHAALRDMWRCGGADQAAAEIIAKRWGLVS
jgi:hypothetical protein